MLSAKSELLYVLQVYKTTNLRLADISFGTNSLFELVVNKNEGVFNLYLFHATSLELSCNRGKCYNDCPDGSANNEKRLHLMIRFDEHIHILSVVFLYRINVSTLI